MLNCKTYGWKNRRNSLWSQVGEGFLGMTPKVQTIKEQTDKLCFIKIKNFCSSEALKSMKRWPTDQGRIFAKPICVKGVVPKYTNKPQSSIIKKINNLFKNMQKI